ncbi:MAG: glycerol kinase GlpK [Sphaerochaetaceae bacterium]|nr:glycerol kinase GlpK [Sphaerochaetaceae bacterium]MDD3162686.1 glycerol kinase GlpK [Sphaerochaetaceae bacterium]MDD4007040.1 glycerol kinase GlpK [Sphaerochaetaceae bacterium]
MKYIGSIDQGTTSTRFIIFNENGEIIGLHQLEHKQLYPKPGWVEHDPEEIWGNTCECIRETLKKTGLQGSDISAIGITNQRETITAWNPKTGEIYHNSIVWQDLRGSRLIDSLKERGKDIAIQRITGLIPSPYFAASKIAWLLDNVPELKEKAASGEAVFGTIDCWLIYKLTGGQAVVTDATNASRYMLMDIKSLKWDPQMLKLFGLKSSALPEIVSSTGEVYGTTVPEGPFKAEIPVCGALGDQQAALFGQACFKSGQAKCTYGTGCFLLENTGSQLCRSTSGLLSTVAFKAAGEAPVYALEGSIAVAGSLVQWARDNLKMVSSPQELDQFASEVTDCGGVYVVPAFSGLFAPYWRSDARGIIAGLTGFATRNHICRAILESTAFQAYDIFKAIEADSRVKMTELKVDGGLTNSEPLMKFQSDVLRVPVIRPHVVETTALGAAYAAGLTAGVFKSIKELESQWKEEKRWTMTMDEKTVQNKIRFWKKAVEKTLNWVD